VLVNDFLVSVFLNIYDSLPYFIRLVTSSPDLVTASNKDLEFLRHHAINLKVAGSSPDDVDFFN
jgi:hypothetical protein